MRTAKLLVVLFSLLLALLYTFAIPAKSSEYGECPKDKNVLYKLYEDSYRQLLALSATGEGGKMNTPEKEDAAKKYKFYAECMQHNGSIPFDAIRGQNSLLLSCNEKIDTSNNMLILDMKIREKEPYRSLKRVEISIRDKAGKEYFRAMVNRSTHAAPIPPNAFGVYPVGERERLALKDVKSAGMEANIPIESKYGNLVRGCRTSDDQGVLNIHWHIHLMGLQHPNGKCSIYVKIIPEKYKNSRWEHCSTFTFAAKTPDPQANERLKINGTTSVKPILCNTENDCFEANKITLINFERQKRHGTLKRWSGDTAYNYSYKELSKRVIDLERLSDHRVILKPGVYQFKYNDVTGDPPFGFYGESEIFEVTAGKKMEIPVRVNSAI